MFVVALTCLALIFLTTFIHYQVLNRLKLLTYWTSKESNLFLFILILSVFATHILQISLYASSLYVLIDSFQLGGLNGTPDFSWEACFLFSAEIFTSLSFGDVTTFGPVRLMSGIEALNGLLLIAWSASFIFLSVSKFQKKNTSSDN